MAKIWIKNPQTNYFKITKTAASLPGSDGQMPPVPKVRLSGGLEICRVLNGMWQVSGSHGVVDQSAAGILRDETKQYDVLLWERFR